MNIAIVDDEENIRNLYAKYCEEWADINKIDLKTKFFSSTNKTSSKKQEKFGRIFKSTKGDNRGLGLISIDEIVDKYDGYINRNSEDNAFTTEILI
ncbi:GHKL domain-containing protein [Finegoldia sp. BIOML-A2]|uniref:GHKL domain-containing protein n=1 Tax=unclassified Finegoldia TaxID=2619637 RepID=UPI0012B14AEE|nr:MULTISPECIES: GHKL domain-containing protein [unclassified Finegoldia]MSA96793.1 GHKL domain-containing protein [Finegoldia sp. BIOML-A5]MSB00178.1 GHKL domain-containing protein [Finegoldia sp. BIOML-A2]